MAARCLLLICAAWLVGACGGHPAKSSAPPNQTAPAGLKLRHQILFETGGEQQVFEGYMLLWDNALMVKAFAGPGVDLFTVVRNASRHKEELHINGLADRIDMAKVSEDIGRVYRGGCGRPPAAASELTCTSEGETLIERTDAAGRVVERRYPKAHGIGVAVRFEEFTRCAGKDMAQSIELSWGTGRNKMVIRLVACEELATVDKKLFEVN